MTAKSLKDIKEKLPAPKVEFSEYQIGKNTATQANVIFESPQKTLRVNFYGDLQFKEMCFGEEWYEPIMCVDIYEKDNKTDSDFKKDPIASDKGRPRVPSLSYVECTAQTYDYMALAFSREDCLWAEKDPFLRYLRNTKFKGNSDNLNEFIKYAQKIAIEKFSEYNKQRLLAEQQAEQQAEEAAANANKDLGQRLFDEYLPRLEEEVRSEIEAKVKNSKIGKLRQQIDDKYGTHLVERKIKRQVKRKVARAARKSENVNG